MNQILEIRNRKIKYKKIFKIQFLISFFVIVILFIYVLNENKIKNNENKITNIALQNARIASLFGTYYSNIYFCILKIDTIDLEYYVYNEYQEELLKILPCKFSGGELNENTNICIIGHNYFDNRFFGNINKLAIGDKITLEDLQGKEYDYYVYEIYEIGESEIYEVIKNEDNEKIVTLCTCTTDKDMRLIIKAKML